MSGRPERGLGRGLGAILPMSGSAAGAEPGIAQLPLEQIEPSERQPRTHFDEAALEELAASIREHGVLQPVIVTRAPGRTTYRLIAGERRWRAARRAGLATVPAVVRESTPQSSLELALVENLQREDLNPLEEARAYRALMDDFAYTQEALAKRLGKSRVAVANRVRLLQLSPPVQEALLAGAITEGHARAILGVASQEGQEALLARVLEEGLSVRQTEALARAPEALAEGAEADDARTPETVDADVARLEDAFRQALGTRVRLVRSARGSGRLVIHFFSDEELEGLYAAIVGGERP